ncbi:MAG: hypothetical protein H0X30_27935 [Anaerolineae bacterium]|nr:hypothetical protein [Anaerolineae bacterium]
MVGWGERIAHTFFQVISDDEGLLLETIDSKGSVQRQTIGRVDYLPRIMWIKYHDEWWVATQTMDDDWQITQPKTHQQFDLASPPILQLHDGQGAKLKPDSTAWQILTEDGEIISIPYEGLTAISPNGKVVVHLRERKAFVWKGGQEMVPLLPNEAADWEIITLLWTPMIWVASG